MRVVGVTGMPGSGKSEAMKVAHKSFGKRLEADQLFWDRNNDWIFTEGRFTLTNPEEGTLLNGTGMDFNRDFSYFNAHQTGGQMEVPEEEDPS